MLCFQLLGQVPSAWPRVGEGVPPGPAAGLRLPRLQGCHRRGATPPALRHLRSTAAPARPASPPRPSAVTLSFDSARLLELSRLKNGVLGNAHEGVNVDAEDKMVSDEPIWRLLQYRVDMKPDVDHTGSRKALLYVHKDILPKMIFD